MITTPQEIHDELMSRIGRMMADGVAKDLEIAHLAKKVAEYEGEPNG